MEASGTPEEGLERPWTGTWPIQKWLDPCYLGEYTHYEKNKIHTVNTRIMYSPPFILLILANSAF
jgi:hypothetical protein